MQNYTLLEVPESIATAIKLLSIEQRQQVFDFVTFLSNRQEFTLNRQPQASIRSLSCRTVLVGISEYGQIINQCQKLYAVVAVL